MGKYVDGYVVPVPKRNVDAYRRLAETAGRVWREHGARAVCYTSRGHAWDVMDPALQGFAALPPEDDATDRPVNQGA